MGNESSQQVQVLQPNSFVDEKLERGGYRVLGSESDTFTFTDRNRRNIGLDLYFDVIVAIDSVECHDPREQDDRNFHKYISLVRSQVYKDTYNWLSNLSECTTEDDFDEYLMLQPSQIITIHVLNLRIMKFRQVEIQIKAEVSSTLDNRVNIEIPPLGLRIIYVKTCEMIRQFYSITDIERNSILNANSINLDSEILVGYAVWESEQYGFRYCILPINPKEFVLHIGDCRNKRLQLFLYDYKARSRRTIEVLIAIDSKDELVLGMTAESRVQIWCDMIRIKPDDPELDGTSANSPLNKPSFVDNLRDCGIIPLSMDTAKLASLKDLPIIYDHKIDPESNEIPNHHLRITTSPQRSNSNYNHHHNDGDHHHHHHQDNNNNNSSSSSSGGSSMPYPLPLLAKPKKKRVKSSTEEIHEDGGGDGGGVDDDVLQSFHSGLLGKDPTAIIPTTSKYVETVSFDPLDPSTIGLLSSNPTKKAEETNNELSISISGLKVNDAENDPEILFKEELKQEVEETSTPRWADETKLSQAKKWLNDNPHYMEVCLEICKRNYCEGLDDIRSYIRQIEKVKERKVQLRVPQDSGYKNWNPK